MKLQLLKKDLKNDYFYHEFKNRLVTKKKQVYKNL